jgi:hypothetical protein
VVGEQAFEEIVLAERGWSKSSDASLWRRMWSRSAGVANVFSGTSTAPTLPTAYAATIHSGEFAIQIATRAPFTTPAPISARASSRTRASSSR